MNIYIPLHVIQRKCQKLVEYTHYLMGFIVIKNTALVTKLSATAFVAQLAEHCSSCTVTGSILSRMLQGCMAGCYGLRSFENCLQYYSS